MMKKGSSVRSKDTFEGFGPDEPPALPKRSQSMANTPTTSAAKTKSASNRSSKINKKSMNVTVTVPPDWTVLEIDEELNDTEETETYDNPFCNALKSQQVDDFFDEADKLYHAMNDSLLIKDRRYRLKQFKMCFKGDVMVTWLVMNKYASSRQEAASIGVSLLLHGVIHHVCDDHNFKDVRMFYRFRKDDNTYMGNLRFFRQTAFESIRLHAIIKSKFPKLISKRDYKLTSYKNCFVGSDVVDWLLETGRCRSRENATELMKRMMAFGFLEHVTSDHVFKDQYLYYRFYADNINSDRLTMDMTTQEDGLARMGHFDGINTMTSSLPPIPGGRVDAEATKLGDVLDDVNVDQFDTANMTYGHAQAQVSDDDDVQYDLNPANQRRDTARQIYSQPPPITQNENEGFYDAPLASDPQQTYEYDVEIPVTKLRANEFDSGFDYASASAPPPVPTKPRPNQQRPPPARQVTRRDTNEESKNRNEQPARTVSGGQYWSDGFKL